MDILVQKDLLNAGLVELTATMRDRYNGALESLGIEPTDRKRIFVDGAGWSPEVAQEKCNNYYLCSGGLINPVVIIVSPAQYKKPVFFPAFSWMRPAMRLFFEKYHREILDTTTTHAIVIDCENGLSSLECPGDLLLLSEVLLKPQCGNLIEVADEQGKLITHFLDGLNCLEGEVCEALEIHRKTYGDLRKRRLVMNPVRFDYCNDFYTAAFDGVAIIRGVDGSDMLIIEDKEQFEAMLKSERCGAVPAWYLYETGKRKRDPIRHLMNADMVVVPFETFRSDPSILEGKRELLLALSLCDCEEGLEWKTLGSGKKKALLSKHEDRVLLYAELERFTAALRAGVAMPEISQELEEFLAVPAPDLPAATAHVLWILLTRREPRNILELYTHDKNNFIARYREWKQEKKTWVAHYLALRYQPHMSQP